MALLGRCVHASKAIWLVMAHSAAVLSVRGEEGTC